MKEVQVREAGRGDAGVLLALMRESAPAIHEEVHPSITVQALEEAGWDKPVFRSFLAEEVNDDGGVECVVGYALSHHLYSTWEGSSSALRHLYVLPTHRRRGIATRLWRTMIKASLGEDCQRCDCFIPNQNVDALRFCLKVGGMTDLTVEEGWYIFRMDQDYMKTFLQGMKLDISGVKIRPATREDFTGVHKLIQDLADDEKMPDGPRIDANTLGSHALDKNPPLAEYWVAEDVSECGQDDTKSGPLVAYSLFFPLLSCEGRAVYMEDLYVDPSHRSRGIGQALWGRIMQAGLKAGALRCEWEVLDFNHQAIGFYKSKGAKNITVEKGYHLLRMLHPQMLKNHGGCCLECGCGNRSGPTGCGGNLACPDPPPS